MRRALALVLTLWAVALLEPAARSAAPHSFAAARRPAVTLWAWERPEDLRGLAADVGVAFLAQTLTLNRDTLTVARRRQPLRVDPGTPLIAVTRIEMPAARTSGRKGLTHTELSRALTHTEAPLALTHTEAPRALTHTEVDRLAESIARTRELPRVAGIQIDFDATVSQRALYRDLLHRVRRRVGTDYPLSITALASWCMEDNWLDALPVDEAVPMLFRMGPGWPSPRRAQALSLVTAPACLGSVGLSLDEPLPIRPRGRRVYLFNPSSWNAASIAAATAEASR